MRHPVTLGISCDEPRCEAEISKSIFALGNGQNVEEFAVSRGWQVGELTDSLRRFGGDRCPLHTQWPTTPLAGVVCPTCGALVAQDRKRDHETWHKP